MRNFTTLRSETNYVHREGEERDGERELDRAPHNEKTDWNPSFLVDSLWISCLENGSKKVNISIFAVLNMCEPALDEENRTVTTQYSANTYQKHWFIPQKIQAKQVTGVQET